MAFVLFYEQDPMKTHNAYVSQIIQGWHDVCAEYLRFQIPCGKFVIEQNLAIARAYGVESEWAPAHLFFYHGKPQPLTITRTNRP